MHDESILHGKKCQLKPLCAGYYDALAAIVLAHPTLYQFTTLGHSEAHFAQWFEKACAEQAWVIINKANNKVIGSSRFYHIEQQVACGKIGYTWLSPDAVGMGINTEVKYLMLTEAFERLKWVRVGFDIDSDNVRSRQAVEKIGAVLEGVLRLHRRRLDGTLSDTCCYSVIDDEWSSVKARLEQQMKANR